MSTKIAVVFANRAVIDPTIDVHKIATVGATWGSWQQWHQCHPNNVVCHDRATAERLIASKFYTLCNLCLPQTVHTAVAAPDRVLAYAGGFVDEVEDPEEIVALHLAEATAGIIVLIGFDWARPELHATLQNSNKQWVLITESLPDALRGYSRIHTDSLENLLD